MKKGAVIALLCCSFFAIAALFWYNEWIYTLPTPVPAGYKAVTTGSHISLPGLKVNNSSPVFLHFFNPDCPCSKFNLPHLRSLVKQYNSKVQFVVVAMTDDAAYTPGEIQQKLRLSVPVLIDSSIASGCGVYSTPQAVILDEKGQLFFRGNYNKSRYCTDKKSNYAQIALDALLNRNSYPEFNHFALQAYGCELPSCKKKNKLFQ